MTQRQQFALANPVDPDDLLVLEPFAETIRGEHQSYGTILTVDRADCLCWHACVTVLSRNLKPVPYSGLSHLQRKAAERLVRDLLKDVGQPDSEQLRWDPKCIHLIRKVTVEEQQELAESKSV